MFSPEGVILAPIDGEGFNFPFSPYDSQLVMMRDIYKLIEDGKIGMCESPTGTGKSLTLSCAVLTWLNDHEALVDSEMKQKIAKFEADLSNPVLDERHNWFYEQAKQVENRHKLAEMKEIQILKDGYEKRLKGFKDKTAEIKSKKIKRSQKAVADSLLENDGKSEDPVDDFLVDDIDEDEDVPIEADQRRYKPVQIIFTSRTHSQLGQVVNEIKRTKFAENIRITALASRQNLCINPDVKKLGSNALINERCLELQKKTAKSTLVDEDRGTRKKRKVTKKCPFYNREAIEELAIDSLYKVQDIEDLVTSGKQLKACPYYASRAAVPDSQLLMVPYQILLHKKTREQTGIDIANSVIVIDEAHNLLDAILNIHSHEMTLDQLQKARLQIDAYKTRYSSMLSASNLLKINQLLFVTTRLCKLLEVQPDPETTYRIIKNDDLKIEGDFLNMNLRDILEFAERMRLAQKIHGFALSAPQKLTTVPPDRRLGEKQTAKSGLKSFLKQLESSPVGKSTEEVAKAEEKQGHNNEEKDEPVTNVIRPLIAFLECLEDNADSGRVYLSYNSDPKQARIRYFLLSSGSKFDLHVHCRSLILAGGTLQPIDEIDTNLFHGYESRLQTYFYPHVAPAEAILPMAIGRGPSGKELKFDFTNRKKKDTLKELASTLQNICQVVPNGVVCFFTSYDYLDYFISYIQESGDYGRLAERKCIYQEHRSGLNSDNILAEYSRKARQCNGSMTGALMLSVVGGKFSEGLNFSDELGRCVIVVGMPYPNRADPVLIERERFMNTMINTHYIYYENICMRAVNQCIGRAIRHINDYASVVLLDIRYAVRSSAQTALPHFVRETLKCPKSYGQAHASFAKFFKKRAVK
ncbi:ATP-dependent DNA helicase DDX11 [Toxorhynchites rutilus septentrionalis]|uniref:ATP-dependent DNA helicase DDX11 n=1 Tax=Toxorhynchites rutilus septentrionalis TaxID=329112 RepID=UPI002479AEB3|nr:ATP-dependent DNA helicase DDX11 [Toxorhynchites rutilus septentrionalis]XP_055638818.1 ATP-dependent DNA helicase DDX11 [Toxorhynchites rutilus septentrionalis]